MSSFTMYSTPWCGYCHRLKSQLDREGIAFDVVDIEQQPEAAQIVEKANNGNQTVPTLVYSDGSSHDEPLAGPGQGEARRPAPERPPPSSRRRGARRLTTGRGAGRRTSARSASG